MKASAVLDSNRVASFHPSYSAEDQTALPSASNKEGLAVGTHLGLGSYQPPLVGAHLAAVEAEWLDTVAAASIGADSLAGPCLADRVVVVAAVVAVEAGCPSSCLDS